jgi:hypothetical protein
MSDYIDADLERLIELTDNTLKLQLLSAREEFLKGIDRIDKELDDLERRSANRNDKIKIYGNYNGPI